MSASVYTIASNAFAYHCAGPYGFVELDHAVVNLARCLVEGFTLRSPEAIQVASALAANEGWVAAALSTLTVLASDDRMNRVVAAEGLALDNPNLHP